MINLGVKAIRRLEVTLGIATVEVLPIAPTSQCVDVVTLIKLMGGGVASSLRPIRDVLITSN